MNLSRVGSVDICWVRSTLQSLTLRQISWLPRVQAAAIRWLELNSDWRQWGRAWLSTVHSVQLILPKDSSEEQQRERVAALVRQCPGCTSIRLSVRERFFSGSAASDDTTRTALTDSHQSSESDSGSLSSHSDDDQWEYHVYWDINAGLDALAELMGTRLLKLDLSNNCGLGSSNYRRLRYENETGLFMNDGLSSVAAHCPNITSLDLSYCVRENTIDDLFDFEGIHPETLLRLVESCGGSLQSLRIAGLRFVLDDVVVMDGAVQPVDRCTPDVLTEIIELCPALKYLSIQKTDLPVISKFSRERDGPPSSPFVNALVSTCADLEFLDIRHVGSRWDAGCLKAVVECCKKLKEIRWSSGSAISYEMRMAMAERYPHLRLTAEEEKYDTEDPDESFGVDSDDYYERDFSDPDSEYGFYPQYPGSMWDSSSDEGHFSPS